MDMSVLDIVIVNGVYERAQPVVGSTISKQLVLGCIRQLAGCEPESEAGGIMVSSSAPAFISLNDTLLLENTK